MHRTLMMFGLAMACTTAPLLASAFGMEGSSQIFSGTLRIVFADGVETGRLDQPDGRCLGVSLPRRAVAQLRASGPRSASIKGQLFHAPEDIEIATIRVNGRLVGFRQCGNDYVFVSKGTDVKFGK